jgi:hypothetical protein
MNQENIVIISLKIEIENQADTCKCKVSWGDGIDRVLMRVAVIRNLQFQIANSEYPHFGVWTYLVHIFFISVANVKFIG